MPGKPPPEPHSLLIKPPFIDKTAFLDRALNRITTVYPGEGFSAVLLAINIFLLLSAFFVLKTVRDVLILQQGGAEVKSYAAAAQSVTLLFALPLFGLVASRIDRVRLINGVTLFFLSHLILFSVAGMLGWRVDRLFYLWLGVFNVLVIAQFWSFSSDVYSSEQGKRLFPVIGIGSGIGAFAGAKSSGALWGAWGPYWLMLFAAGLLAASLVITWLVNKYVCECGGPQSVIARLPVGKEGGFALLLSNRYLMLIALLTMMLNLMSTSGDFLLSKLVVAEAGALPVDQRAQWISRFYGDYYGWTTALGLGLQVFAVAPLFRRIGPQGALFLLPCFGLGTCGLLLAAPMLLMIQAAKAVEAGVETSIQNTAGHALFLDTSREAKYKAKAAIDTFFWRTGDVVHAGVVYLGTQLAFTLQHYAAIHLGLLMVWLGVVVALNREYRASRPELNGKQRWRVMAT